MSDEGTYATNTTTGTQWVQPGTQWVQPGSYIQIVPTTVQIVPINGINVQPFAIPWPDPQPYAPTPEPYIPPAPVEVPEKRLKRKTVSS